MRAGQYFGILFAITLQNEGVFCQPQPQGTCVSLRNKGCDNDQTGIYTDYDHTDGSGDFSVRCCDKLGTPKEQKKALSCRITPCITAASGVDLCPNHGVNRWINGSKLEYKEIEREQCLSEYNEKGMVGLCCPKDSKSEMLTSMLGAEKHRFPHFARIMIATPEGSLETCGGTIYNEWFIITASHCVMKNGTMKPTAESFVNLDVHLSSDYSAYRYDIEKFIVHPDSTLRIVRRRPGGLGVNDMALVKLKTKIDFGSNANIKALPIAKPDFNPFKYADNAVIIGVGVTDTLAASPILQRVNVVLRDDERNIDGYGHFSELSMQKHASGVLFLGGVQDDIESPHGGEGDSGGPAICRDENGLAVLCGVASGGKGFFAECVEQFTEFFCTPDKYMEVAHFNEWIVTEAGPQRNENVAKIPLYGAKVPDDKFEHQVRVTSSFGGPCGGTLIDKDVVVTAAHCVVDDNGNRKSGLKVTAQLRDLNSKSGKDFEVVSQTILEGFKRREQGSRRKRIAMFKMNPNPKEAYYTNDLALVKLREKVAISSKKLAKIGQATFSDDNGNPIWYTEVSFPLNATRSGALQEREFKLLQPNTCQRRLSRARYSNDNIKFGDDIMCGLEKYNGGAQCDRELGGGLICGTDSDGMDILCGVQTYRFCHFALPSAFLDVGKLKPWIEDAKRRL